MGDLHTRQAHQETMRAFMKAVLNDIHALEQMIAADMFEKGRRRVDAEQEKFLVDQAMRPCSVAIEILGDAGDRRITSELARLNIEANTEARLFGGSCLRQMEAELHEPIELVYRTVGQFMSTDLFTVHPEDLVDLAASVMDWEHIRHMPVEDEHGRLVGIITHRTLLRFLARGGAAGSPVADLLEVSARLLEKYLSER